jgi:uncharacterized Zn finger protein (UPF0148 family)
MSDFDKEAERERLREKYERDEEKREVTERMSELLLKGATMTNAHCSDCGDPIFRYDGQEFCATCQKAVQRQDGQGGQPDDEANEEVPADGADGATADQPATNGDRDEIHVAAPDETRVQFGGNAGPGEDAGTAHGTSSEDSSAVDADPETRAGDPSRSVPGVEPDQSGDLEAAQAALSRTVTRLARQAEATDDLGRKRDLLAATEEAAESLAALERVNR